MTVHANSRATYAELRESLPDRRAKVLHAIEHYNAACVAPTDMRVLEYCRERWDECAAWGINNITGRVRELIDAELVQELPPVRDEHTGKPRRRLWITGDLVAENQTDLMAQLDG